MVLAVIRTKKKGAMSLFPLFYDRKKKINLCFSPVFKDILRLVGL